MTRPDAAGLRILVVTNMYPTPEDPAYGAFVATEVRALSRVGVKLDVRFVDGRRDPMVYAAAPFQIGRLARAGRYDVVHAHYGLTGFVSGFHPRPLVITFHGDDLFGTPAPGGGITLKSRVVRQLSRRAARRADAVVCHSEILRDALPRAGDRSRAFVIPMGVDVDAFTPGVRAEARARLGMEGAPGLVLFPSTPNVPRKRIDLAQAAVASLAADGTPVSLWTVSGVPHGRMPDYYRAADCVIVTSDQESGPMAAKEALCCDCPVVSVDVGDVRQLFGMTSGCRLVERSVESIAAGLREVLGGRGRVDGAAVRSAVSADAIAQRLIGVYHDAIARRGM